MGVAETDSTFHHDRERIEGGKSGTVNSVSEMLLEGGWIC